MKSIAYASILLLASASWVHAADLPAEEVQPVMTAPFSWTGVYIGAVAGYGWGKFKSRNVAATHSLREEGDPLDHVKGWLVGGTVGYNQQFDNVVVGLEADLAWTDADDHYVTNDPEFKGDVKYLGTVKARVGYAVDRFLPFVTAGFAYGRTKLRATDNAVGISASDSKTQYGFVGGGGVEYAITDSVSLKGEYNYIQLSRKKHDVSDAVFFGSEDIKYQTHLLKVGVNYHF